MEDTNKLTKQDIANKLASQHGLTKRDALDIVTSIFDCKDGILANAFSSGKTMSIVGFGTMGVKAKKGRKGRNPRTGETVMVPERNVVYFRPGAPLNELVNQ